MTRKGRQNKDSEDDLSDDPNVYIQCGKNKTNYLFKDEDNDLKIKLKTDQFDNIYNIYKELKDFCVDKCVPLLDKGSFQDFYKMCINAKMNN